MPMPWEERPSQNAQPMPWEARPTQSLSRGTSDDWSTPTQRFTGALSESVPLANRQAPSDAQLAAHRGQPLSDALSETFNPMPALRGIAQPVQELFSGKVPEGLGHLAGAASAPGGPEAEVLPLAKGAVRGGLRVAASTPAATMIGAGVGESMGHPWIGAGIGRGLSGYAQRGLDALDKPPEPQPSYGPGYPAIAKRAADPPPLLERVNESPARPRADWRQAIVDEANAKPAETAQPANTITTPETAPQVDVNPREASSRSSLAQKMAAKLHEAGAPVEDIAKLSDTDPFWKTLEDSVREGGKATRAKPPSPETIQLVREGHGRLMGNSAKPAAIGGAPRVQSSLTGKPRAIAERLAAEMSK